MRLKAAAVILAWCLIGWSGMVVAQEPISKADRAIWLVDDFEDQNLVGWTIPSGPCTASIAAVGAAGSNYSMVIDGACGHDGGTSYDLGGIQATSLSLYVKTTTTMNAHLYFILDDDSQATNGYILAFLATSSGWFSAFGAGAQYDLMPINSTDWHQLQFSIDWVGKNVDISINGVPRQYNLPFATDSISTLRQIHLYNLHDNTAWYDQIVLSTPPPSIMLMSDDFESADLSGWATSIPTLPLRLVIYHRWATRCRRALRPGGAGPARSPTPRHHPRLLVGGCHRLHRQHAGPLRSPDLSKGHRAEHYRDRRQLGRSVGRFHRHEPLRRRCDGYIPLVLGQRS